MTDADGLESALELSVMDGVEIEAAGVSGGKVKVSVYATLGEDREVLYSQKHRKDFIVDRTERGEIKNGVADSLEDTVLDVETWRESWKQKAGELAEQYEQSKVTVVPENVRMLADGTSSVETGVKGDSRIYQVTLRWQGQTATLEFNHKEMANNSPGPLKERCVLKFAKEPEIEPEDWDSLKKYWMDIQQHIDVEAMTETDRKVDQFLSELRRRVIPHETADALANGVETAWVDMGNSHGVNIRTELDAPRGVVWVKNQLVSDILDDIDDAPRVGELGKELADRGNTVRSSERLQKDGMKKRCWFFTMQALDITEMDIHSDDRADGGGVVDV